MAPNNSPITHVITNDPVTSIILLILFANRKVIQDRVKVNNMANITIIFNSGAVPTLITNITVVIAPGPANKGMAIGKIETSSRLVAPRISSAVTLSRGDSSQYVCHHPHHVISTLQR